MIAKNLWHVAIGGPCSATLELLCLTLLRESLGFGNLRGSGGGYDVLTTGSSGDALATLQQAKPDLMLLDIRMPDIDGYQMYARMQQDTGIPHIPVIFVTGLGGKEVRARALALGGAGYVAHPSLKSHAILFNCQILYEALGMLSHLVQNQIGYDFDEKEARRPRTCWRISSTRRPYDA